MATKKTTSASKSTKTPQTMEDLLKAQNVTFIPFKRGDRVQATIITVGKREVVADIGAKSYGVVVGREFEAVSQMVKTLSPGDIIEAEIIIPEMESGDTLISLRRTLIDSLWESVTVAQEKGRPITAKVTKPISGGILVDYKTLRGFIPQAQVDPKTREKGESLIGKSITVQVLEASQKQNRLVLSEIEVTQKEMLAKKRKALETFKEGDTVVADVVSVDDYTVTLNVTHKKAKTKKTAVKEPVSGVIHISELSWERVDAIGDTYKEGDTIEVKVVSIDDAECRLNLSLKQMTKDPWDDIEKRLSEEKQVSGTIVKKSNIGVFVELEKGVEGLIHVSKVPTDHEFEIGEKVSVTIDTLDTEKRKISLSYVPVSKPIGYR